MSEGKGQGEHHIPVGGIFVLFLGIVFLLQSLSFLPWGLWETLWRFWPVLIIIIGLGILLRRQNVWLVSLLILILLFACLGIAYWQYRLHSTQFTEKMFTTVSFLFPGETSLSL